MNVNIYRGDLQACRVCLATDIKLISLQDFALKRTYSEFSGMPIMATDGLPQHVCVFCCELLKKSSEFREKCKASYMLLLGHLLEKQVLTSSYIDTIDRSHLRIPLYTSGVLECSCLPDDTCSTHEDASCKTEPTSDIESVDLDYFYENSNIDNDINNASFKNKYTDTIVKPVEQIINELFVMKCIKEHDYIGNSTRVERIQSDAVERIEDFKNKQFNEITCTNKQENLKDIVPMIVIRKIRNGRIIHTRESLALFSKEFNFDVMLMNKEEKIQDVLKRKESKNYKMANYKCEQCFIGFAAENTFQNHKASHDPSLPYECEYCHLRFKNPRSRKQHLFNAHSYKFVCRQCGQVKRNANIAREHYKSHLGFNYVCEHCGATFDKYKSRVSHVQIHHGTLSCDTCHMKFTREAGLIVHKNRAHRELFKCPSCLVQFHNPNALRTHAQVTTGGCGAHIRPCTQCGESFNDEMGLKQHMDRHRKRPKRMLKARPPIQRKPGSQLKQRKEKKDDLICDICAKVGFRCEALLRMHQQRIHSDERPFICDYCKKTFKMKANLKQHISQIHNDKRRYSCPQPHCSKAFRQSHHLTNHLRSHSNEKAFSCVFCQKHFKYKDSLVVHRRTVHEGLPPRNRDRRVK